MSITDFELFVFCLFMVVCGVLFVICFFFKLSGLGGHKLASINTLSEIYDNEKKLKDHKLAEYEAKQHAAKWDEAYKHHMRKGKLEAEDKQLRLNFLEVVNSKPVYRWLSIKNISKLACGNVISINVNGQTIRLRKRQPERSEKKKGKK